MRGSAGRMWLVACAAVLVAGQAAALTEVLDFGSNPGGLRMFVYLPASLQPGAGAVVALHGCGQQAADYESAGWNALADAHGFVVVYPQQTPINNYYRCFTWWGDELTRGADENQSIQQMVEHVVQNHGVDPARVFVSGLSAGGAAAVNLLATWPDVFAAGGVIAGIPYGCAPTLGDTSACIDPAVDRSASAWGQFVRDAHVGVAGGYPRVSLWQGTADGVVSSSNLRELTEQWLDVHGLSSTPARDETAGVVRHQVYRLGQGPDLVEVYTLQGVDHGTPVDPQQGCGVVGGYFLDLDLCSALRMAEFFGLVDAGPGDAGAGDAGGGDLTARDAGAADLDPGTDAAGTPDAAASDLVPFDARMAEGGFVDALVPVGDGGAVHGEPPGCGCRGSTEKPGTPHALVLVLATVLAVRRRR